MDRQCGMLKLGRHSVHPVPFPGSCSPEACRHSVGGVCQCCSHASHNWGPSVCTSPGREEASVCVLWPLTRLAWKWLKH